MADAVARAAAVPADARAPRRDVVGRPRPHGRASRSPRARPALRESASRWAAASCRCWRPARRDVGRPRSPTSGRRRSNGSSTAPASRCTVTATRCGSTRRNLNDVTGRLPGVVELVRGAAGARGRARRRGDRRRRRGAAARVPGHDELVRARRDAGGGAAAVARRVLLRRAARRRRRPHRPAARASGSRSLDALAGERRIPGIVTAIGRRGRGVPRRRARGRARGRDGEGARLDRTTPVAAAARGAR